MAKRHTGKPRKQVAALPVAIDSSGAIRVLVVTSRATKRFIVPKGWPMKGIEDRRVAEIEAREEAGLIGTAHPKPIGSYLAWKRMRTRFELVKVKVFLLDVTSQLSAWKEQGERQMAWLSVDDAGLLLDEPGLAALVSDLARKLPKKWRSKGRAPITLMSAQARRDSTSTF